MIPCCCAKGKCYIRMKNMTPNPYNWTVRHQLQCCIWFEAVSFKEDVDLPVGFRAGAAGGMRLPEASDEGLVSRTAIV